MNPSAYTNLPQGFDDLYAWSCDKRADFWGHLWETQRWIHEGSYTTVVDESLPIDALPAWFEGVRLNFAENLLYRRGLEHGAGTRGTQDKEDAKVALTEIREGGVDERAVTWAELRRDAGRLASAMEARGVKKGDRVVIVGANSYTTLLVMLATTWLGGLFSSSSTDMGVNGLLQRTVQIDPKASIVYMATDSVSWTNTSSLSFSTTALCTTAMSSTSATK